MKKYNKEEKSYKQRKDKGQFFTPVDLADKIIKKFKIELKDKSILEPSCGDGSFIDPLIEQSASKIVAIDIDPKQCKTMKKKYSGLSILNMDFLDYKTKERFDLIIGNPPFNLPQFGYFDSTEAFISHGIDLLNDNGDLIFILPNTVLRNKCYQPIRNKILNETKIINILDTRGNDFLGADIETIALHLKKKKVNVQKYTYYTDNKAIKIALKRNERDTIKLMDDGVEQSIAEHIGNTTIKDLFDVYRGRSKQKLALRGRNIDFYDDIIKDSKETDYYIGLQNIAYRFVANVIQANEKNVSDTITLLKPKEKLSEKQLRYLANYLNTPIANYELHAEALNNSRLTTHIDKYYIDDITIPDTKNMRERDIDKFLNSIDQYKKEKSFASIRNDFYYEFYGISNSEKEIMEQYWCLPKYKNKREE